MAEYFHRRVLRLGILPLAAFVGGVIWLSYLSSEKEALAEGNSALRKHLAVKRLRASESERDNGATVDREKRRRLVSMICQLNAAGMKDRRTELELQQMMAGLHSAAEILNLMDEISAMDLPNSSVLLSQLMDAAIAMDPEMAIRHFEGQLADLADPNLKTRFPQAFSLWMEKEPGEAMKWLDEMISSGKLECSSQGIRMNESCQDQMMIDLVGMVIKHAPDQATRLLSELSVPQQKFLLDFKLLDAMRLDAEGFVNLVRGSASDSSTFAYAQITQGMMNEGGLAKVGGFLDSISSTGKERRTFAENAAKIALDQSRDIGDNLNRDSVDATRKWLQKQVPQDADELTGRAIGGRSYVNFEGSANMVKEIYQETGSDDVLVGFLNGFIDSEYAEQRIEMANLIRNEEKRKDVLEKMQSNLTNEDGPFR